MRKAARMSASHMYWIALLSIVTTASRSAESTCHSLPTFVESRNPFIKIFKTRSHYMVSCASEGAL